MMTYDEFDKLSRVVRMKYNYEIIDFIEFNDDDLAINLEYLDDDGIWCDTHSFNNIEYAIYRIKPEPKFKYIPFTAETFEPHRDRWVKWNNKRIKILCYSNAGIFCLNQSEVEFLDWFDTFNIFYFDDGNKEPFGQKVGGE